MEKSPAKAQQKSITKLKETNTASAVFSRFFEMLPKNKEFMFRFLDLFPFPVEIFAPDGTDIFLNRAFMEFNNVTDPSLVIGKYNVINDPVINDQMGLKDGVEKAFRGEIVYLHNVDAPIQDLVNRGIISEKPFEKSVMDFHLYPVMSGKKLIFVVFVCNVRKLYTGRPDVARAREFIDSHWRGEYNAEEVARHVNMSVTQLYRVFKEHTGTTPGDYHKQCKVERIKKRLKNKNLSIKEAFAACGEDSRGWILQVFKEITGMTPKQYRNSLL